MNNTATSIFRYGRISGTVERDLMISVATISGMTYLVRQY